MSASPGPRVLRGAVPAMLRYGRAPIGVSWIVTNRCNLRCVYCGCPDVKTRELKTEQALDVIDELCFLAVECERIGGDNVGRRVLEAYCDASSDRPSEKLLDFYKSYRACVRAKVAALRSAQVKPSDWQLAHNSAESYLSLADRHASLLGPPMLIVVRGLMGTGKSTLATSLAELFGAELLQTDMIRRERLGASETSAAYGEDLYTPHARQAVYDEMFTRAQRMMADGLSVLLDGTFLRAALRTQAVELAQQYGSLPLIIECVCPTDVAKQRIGQRVAASASESEARVDLFSDQQAEQEPDPAGIPSVVIDTTDSIPAQVEAVLCEIRRRSV